MFLRAVERCDLTDMMPDHPAGTDKSGMRQVSNAVNGHGPNG